MPIRRPPLKAGCPAAGRSRRHSGHKLQRPRQLGIVDGHHWLGRRLRQERREISKAKQEQRGEQSYRECGRHLTARTQTIFRHHIFSSVTTLFRAPDPEGGVPELRGKFCTEFFRREAGVHPNGFYGRASVFLLTVKKPRNERARK